MKIAVYCVVFLLSTNIIINAKGTIENLTRKHLPKTTHINYYFDLLIFADVLKNVMIRYPYYLIITMCEYM